MNIFKEYIDYLKDNPNKLWFKRKLYGWGWTPATWQGWLAILTFIFYILLNTIILDLSPIPTNDEITLFFVKTIVGVVILILICSKKGEAPKWQWGIPKQDKNG